MLCPNRVKLSHFVQIVVACGLNTKLRAGGVSAAGGSGVGLSDLLPSNPNDD